MALRQPPIEVQAAPGRPLGMAPARFLRDYWQKRPLLVRGALPEFAAATTPEDLAGLACESAALSRIVQHDVASDRWSVRSGPFAERDFQRLPRSHWTLLVQDVDKWDLDVAALLDRFTFVPSWRVDDVMVSYAVEGGGVGPHVDQYDVFLLQGRGRRRWRISDDAGASHAFRDDAEIKILREFKPTHDWHLAPGDMLYLPPGVPHEGVALSPCLTYSVGMRAPSQAELLFDFAEFLADGLREEQRYADPDLRAARAPGEIDAAALERVRAALPAFRRVDSARLRHWFGTFITRYRAAHEAAPAARPLSAEQVATRLARGRALRNPWSRFAWARDGRRAELFVAGERYACTPALAQALNAAREFDGAELLRQARSAAERTLLAALINAGHLHLLRTR